MSTPGIIQKVVAASVVLFGISIVEPLWAAFDGFNVLSTTFDNQYNGDDIWDGSAYANGWEGATASGGSTGDYSLNGTNLLYNMSTNNGWLQHDNSATPWESGSGSWTVEVRARVGATGGNSGFVIWGALNGERDILTVRENAITSLGGTSYDLSDNTDGFHDFRLVYDADADVYHYFRDAVQITPLTGVEQQGGTTSTRLIVGDCCSNVGGSPFGGVGSSFEVEYIRYDMDGAFSPTTDQGTTVATIDRDTGNITLTNTTGSAIQNVIGYSILSSAGGLSQSGWNQQTGGSQLDNDDDQWTVLTSGGVTTDLSEAVLSTTGSGDGGDLAATTGSWNFGSVWNKSPFEDVALELLLDDGTILNSGTDFQLSYTGNGGQSFSFGDLAGATVNDGPDGDIDFVDWQKFKAGFGADLAGLTDVEAYFAGDLTGDGESNLSDFNEFRSLYDAENGLGALALALAGTAVPEPTAWTLLAIGLSALTVRRRAVKFAGPVRLALLAALGIVATGANGSAQVPVTVFADDFQAYPTSDPADFSATGNWTHNGNGTGPNASRLFDTGNYGGTRLWIASAANAAAGTGIDSRGITSAEGLLGNTDYTFSAAMVSETVDGSRTATGTYNLLVGQTFGTATSVIGGPQAFNARGDHDAGLAESVDDTYDDQRTTLSFNTGAVNPGDQLFISIAFDGTDASNPFVGIDEVEIIGAATIGARVNTATGEVSLFGDSVFDFDITAYSLTSALGQLVPGNFVSLEGQGVGDPGMTPNDGIGFEVLGAPGVSTIAEGQLTTFTTFDNETSLSIGNVFNSATPEGDRDLALTLTTASGEELTAVVEYVTPTGLAGDFNSDGVVDAADYTLWRDNLGAPDESALNNNGDGGGVSASDYVYWKDRYGSTASVVADAASAPEPASALLLGMLSTLVLGRSRRSYRCAATCLSFACVAAIATTALGAQNDRQYDFGDDPFEPASSGVSMSGTTFDSEGTVGAGDLQDLLVNGSPMYVSVSDRPGALAGDLGASFNGTSDSLSTPISLNAPTQMWDNSTFFPGPPPQVFPHNYEGIFSHGIQLWAKPDQLALGAATQTLVSDTNEHGIGITAAGNWELLYDDGRFDTGVSVLSTLDANGWAHLMEISEPGGGAFGGTLLVNGVAVMSRATFYDPEATPLVIGADAVGTSIEDGYENFYDGVLDDVRLFFWGDNSNQLGADGAVGGVNSGGPDPTPIVLNADGQDWGGLDLGNTNDWIAQRLASLGVTDSADVDLSGGLPDAADVTAFVTHWRKQQVIDGVQVGDWNSRQEGDLNYDGSVNLQDAFILHEGLVAAGGAGLDFSLLSGAPAPEPSTAVLAAITALAAGPLRRWRR